jgi:tetratricopeptide (TPR) repeat protein
MIQRTVLRSLLIASFVVATATCAAGREGVFPNTRPDRTWGRTAGGVFISGKSIAVVIAISNYIGTRAGGYPALPTTKHDPDKMLAFLLNDAGFDTVYLLTDEDATKAKIDKLMTDVMPTVVTGRDRFLFYWSGHGDQRFSGDGRPFGFLPLADSKSKEFSGMVSMQDLERWDRYLDARQALFVLDACLSGLAGFQTKAPLNARLEQLSLPARHLITAGTKDEFVIAGDRWGGSLFTDSFILGAKGQARSPSGIVSLPVLLDFIQERVARERELVNWSKSLTPQIQSLQHGEGYFFFTPATPAALPPAGATRQDIPEQKGFPVAVTPPPSQGKSNFLHASVEAYVRRGIEYGDKNQFDRAIAEFNEAIQLDPKNARALYNRGTAYRLMNDYDRAIADYNEAIRLDPKYAYAFAERATVYAENEDYDRAIADYNEAIRLDPKYALAFNNRGTVYRDKGDIGRAIADFNQAILLDPTYARALCNRGRAKLKIGQAGGNADIAKARKLDDSICR